MRRRDCQKLADRYLELYAIAYALLQDTSDTEDAVQEALTRTMSRVIIEDPYVYCRRVLVNICYDTRRYRQRHIQFLSAQDIANPADEPRINESLIDQVRQKIDQLPDRTRLILAMYYDEDLTLTKIAEKTKLSLSTVKKIINKAHRQIKQELIKKNTQPIKSIYHERD